MSRGRLFLLTAFAMAAFAGNSLLCRLALRETNVSAADFTAIRLGSGALMLCVLVRWHRGTTAGSGDWSGALALFAYAAGFALAYEGLTAATGALLLFGAVQATMIGHGLWTGERLRGARLFGYLLALAGLVVLLLPGLATPPLGSSLLMLGAGCAWGIYSLRGRSAGDPTRITAGNFLRAAPLALAWALSTSRTEPPEPAAWGYALASGALASGLGYALWYRALPSLQAAQAGTVQLCVPVLAAIGGVVVLGESMSARLLTAGGAILGGVALVLKPPDSVGSGS